MPKRFRWSFSDDGIGPQTSRWHTADGSCTVCCCGGGPDSDGDHHEPAEYDHGDGLESGHSYCNPVEDAEDMAIEWSDDA